MKKTTRYFLLALSATAFMVLAGFRTLSNDRPTNANHLAGGLQFFNGTLEQGLAAAKSENKNVFVIVHASWCPACKKMNKQVIPQNAVGDAFNSTFINVAVDYDSEAGKKIREKYGITGTPGILFLDADGNQLTQTSGFKSKSELVALAKQWKK